MTVDNMITQAKPITANIVAGLPRFGKLESTSSQIRYPVEEINYNIGGCSILWLNVSNMKEAIEYYDKRFQYFPKRLRDDLAKQSLINKINIAKLNKNNIYK
jgi:hypothetical protein